MNIYIYIIDLFLWFVISIIIGIISDYITNYHEDYVIKNSTFHRIIHETTYGVSGMVLMYIIMTYYH